MRPAIGQIGTLSLTLSLPSVHSARACCRLLLKVKKAFLEIACPFWMKAAVSVNAAVLD